MQLSRSSLKPKHSFISLAAMRYAFQWIFMVLLMGFILVSSILPSGITGIVIFLALIADLYAIRISFINMRIKLEQQGLELGQVIPSTLVIFAWLMYAVVHFQIFLSIVHFLDLPAAALKWVFPLTAIKALWPVYYLGSKLPVKKQDNVLSNKIPYQIPWVLGGAFLWYNSYAEENFEWALILYTLIISLIILLPSIYRLWIERSI